MTGASPSKTVADRKVTMPPRWTGYLAALVIEVALTAGLVRLNPYFPLGAFPITYVLLLMAVAYFFGEGPAVLAFLVGLTSFCYYFVPPAGLWPLADTLDGWTRLAALLLGTTVVGLATIVLRRSNKRISRLAAELSIAHAISETRKTELETILSSMSSGVIVVDENLNITYTNRRAAEIVPVKQSWKPTIKSWVRAADAREIDGSPLEIRNHPLTKALRGQVVPEQPYLVSGQSGGDTVVGAAAAPVRESDGRIVGAVLVMRDVTLQTRLQSQVAQQRALLDTYLQKVPVGLAFIDRQGRYAVANPAIAVMAGLAPDAMIGRRPEEASPTHEAERIEEAVQSVLSSGEPVSWPERKGIAGGERRINVDFLPVRTADGELVGVGVVAVDVTEQVQRRKSLEDQYEHERRIAEMLQIGMLGHVKSRIGCFRFDKIYHASEDGARVGGDFYDVFELSAGSIAIVIGDVSGKGLKSAHQMSAVKQAIRSRAYDGTGPARVLADVNSSLIRQFESEFFVTVFFGVLDSDSTTLTYASGGHEPVLHWSNSASDATELQATGPVVGILPSPAYEERTVQLQHGDELLLATDGLIEVKTADGYLDLRALVDIYRKTKMSGKMSAEAMVDTVAALSASGMRDDAAVLRVVVDQAQ